MNRWFQHLNTQSCTVIWLTSPERCLKDPLWPMTLSGTTSSSVTWKPTRSVWIIQPAYCTGNARYAERKTHSSMNEFWATDTVWIAKGWWSWRWVKRWHECWAFSVGLHRWQWWCHPYWGRFLSFLFYLCWDNYEKIAFEVLSVLTSRNKQEIKNNFQHVANDRFSIRHLMT